MKIILASRSPRRAELLKSAGYNFEVFPASEDAEDSQRLNETPCELVMRLAKQKALDVANRVDTEKISGPAVVLGCDTVAVCNGTIFGKPTDRTDARNMLSMLSCFEHQVLSGVCLVLLPDKKVIVNFDSTTLWMNKLSDVEIEEYLDTNLWRGKAGAFGYQDGNNWVKVIQGSESNVVGLPMEMLDKMIKGT